LAQLQPTSAATPRLSALVRGAIEAYTACEVIDYQAGGLAADGQVMWKDIASVPLLKQVVDGSDDLANLPLFDPADNSLARVRLVAIRTEVNGLAALFVQYLKGQQVVARTKKSGVLVRRGTLDVPDGELIILTEDMTAVLLGSYVFFQNRPLFQDLTGLLEELRQHAAATFELVTVDLRIEGREQMAAAVTAAPNMLGKMASIQGKLDRYPLYKEALTMPRLLKFVGEHPECGVEVIGDGVDARLVFRNDVQHRFKILKLLDDDYLTSELTTLDYEANSKSSPLGV
jgi:hypothetical protein